MQEKHPTGTTAEGVISRYHEYCKCCGSQAACANVLPVIGERMGTANASSAAGDEL